MNDKNGWITRVHLNHHHNLISSRKTYSLSLGKKFGAQIIKTQTFFGGQTSPSWSLSWSLNLPDGIRQTMNFDREKMKEAKKKKKTQPGIVINSQDNLNNHHN